MDLIALRLVGGCCRYAGDGAARRKSLVETAFFGAGLVDGGSLGAEGVLWAWGEAYGVPHACRQMEEGTRVAHLGVVAADGTTRLVEVGGCAAQRQTPGAAGICTEWQHTELDYCPGQRMRLAETCGVAK